MRAVVQRVSQASVCVNEEVVGKIEQGLLVLLGVGQEDTQEDVVYLANKIAGLRIFSDEQEKMNRSVVEQGGAALVVSQFTLWGDCRKGRRPSFVRAADPAIAEPLYELFVSTLQQQGIEIATGRFGAMMEVSLVNDGPVTLLLDSRKEF